MKLQTKVSWLLFMVHCVYGRRFECGCQEKKRNDKQK